MTLFIKSLIFSADSASCTASLFFKVSTSVTRANSLSLNADCCSLFSLIRCCISEFFSVIIHFSLSISSRRSRIYLWCCSFKLVVPLTWILLYFSWMFSTYVLFISSSLRILSLKESFSPIKFLTSPSYLFLRFLFY